MSNCKEFYLDDVLAIIAIPIEDYDFWPYISPLTPTISSEDFAPSFTNAITIGRQRASADGVSYGDLIPIQIGTGKAKDSESDDVAGRKHTVTVSCEADDRDPDVWPLLHTLEQGARHLLLTFRGGNQAFVVATQDTYRCEVSRDGAKTQLQFRIECWAGLQLIVE